MLQFCHITLSIIFNYALQPLRLIVRSGLDAPTFATRHLYARHHATAPSGGRWNCGREMSGKFCLNADFKITYRYLLHVVKGMIRIFHPKNPTASARCEPANLGTKGPHNT